MRKNAVIMAAGIGKRFVPISLEKPKGLLKVRGEILIERQIEQLRDADVEEIIIVVGYKAEEFKYLQEKYDGIILIKNEDYLTKNNSHSLYLARKYLDNTYICSADDYFAWNPFLDNETESYYAAVHVEQKTDEWYMIPDENGCIADVEKTGEAGEIMLGHAFWDSDFSRAFVKILEEGENAGKYDELLWEWVMKENLAKLPKMKIRTYPKDVIFEFDSLSELREFDSEYINHSGCKILENIAEYFAVKEGEISDFTAIDAGLTNRSFAFSVKDNRYVYRHPGDGTEKIISRKHEKKALELAKKIGVDPTYVTMDDEEGWKISEYVSGIRVPDYSNFEDSKRVVKVLRDLHEKNLLVDWEFLPWEEAEKIEKMLDKKLLDEEFYQLKNKVEKGVKSCTGDGVERRFCHCDTYAPNWMLTSEQTILIDWEYAGNADPGCDIGTYIMDSMWEIPEAESFIREYCQEDYETSLDKFMNIILEHLLNIFLQRVVNSLPLNQ